MMRARAIMEAHLGRVLQAHEDVHHIDGNKRNDAISNLMVLTRSEHQRLHAATDKYKNQVNSLHAIKYDRICKTCGCQFKGGYNAKRCNPHAVEHRRQFAADQSKDYYWWERAKESGATMTFAEFRRSRGHEIPPTVTIESV